MADQPDPAGTVDPREQIAAAFDAVADTYDAVGVDFFRPIAEGLARELAPQPGERAVDIGCGRGALLYPLAEGVGASGAVTATDLSERMVASTAADVAAAGLAAPVEVLVDDGQAPARVAPGADLLGASLVLFFLPDPLGALRAWRDLLRVGGRLGVSTFGPYNDEWRAIEEVFHPYLPPELVDPRTREAGPFASDAAMEDLVREAGYVDVRTVTTSVPVRFDDTDQWYAWTWSTGQRRMWLLVPDDERDAVRAEAAARVEQCRQEDGRMGFDQGVRYTLARRPEEAVA
jgi:SAM-dependent methyltransferase